MSSWKRYIVSPICYGRKLSNDKSQPQWHSPPFPNQEYKIYLKMKRSVSLFLNTLHQYPYNTMALSLWRKPNWATRSNRNKWSRNGSNWGTYMKNSHSVMEMSKKPKRKLTGEAAIGDGESGSIGKWVGEYQKIEFRRIKQSAITAHNFISKCNHQKQLNPRIIEVQNWGTISRRPSLQGVEIGRFPFIGWADPIREVLGDQKNGPAGIFSLVFFFF